MPSSKAGAHWAGAASPLAPAKHHHSGIVAHQPTDRIAYLWMQSLLQDALSAESWHALC